MENNTPENLKLKFYEVNNAYLNFLRKFDSRVSQKGGRSFICVEMFLGDKKYYLPLTSQVKTKNGKKRNSLVTTKVLDSKGESIACVLYNNMLPIPSSELSCIEFDSHKFKDYLETEYQYLKFKVEEIRKKASKVYNMRIKGNNALLNSICCDFKLLEKKCSEWENK